MSGLSGLSGRSGLSGAGGGGTSLTPGYEYQKLSPKDFYGKVSVTLDAGTLATGGTVELDFTSGTMSAAALQTALETIADTGNVEVAIIDDYFQIKFIGDLAEYNLDHTTLTPSASYVPNDGSGTAPTKLGQSNYVAAAQEEVTLTLTPIDPGQNAASVDSNGNSITYDFNTTLYTTAAGGDFTCTGGANSATATFESASNGPKNTTYNAIASSNNGTASVTINTAGATEANAQVNVTFTGAAGWITYATSSPSFSVAIPVTALDAAVLAILNDAARYNGTVDSVAMGSTSMTVNFTATNNPGTVTIDGETGAAVTVAVTTLQNGTLEVPTLPTPYSLWTKDSTHWQDTAGTTSAANGDPIGRVDHLTDTLGANLTQGTSGSRPQKTADGWLLDGSSDFLSAVAAIDLTAAPFTLTIQASTSADDQVLCGNGEYNNNGFYLQRSPGGGIRFVTNGAGTNSVVESAGGQFTNGVIHTISVVCDASNVTFVRDGVDVTPGSHAFTAPGASGRDFVIGRYSGGGFYVSGTVGGVRVDLAALTLEQCQQIYTDGLAG